MLIGSIIERPSFVIAIFVGVVSLMSCSNEQTQKQAQSVNWVDSAGVVELQKIPDSARTTAVLKEHVIEALRGDKIDGPELEFSQLKKSKGFDDSVVRAVIKTDPIYLNLVDAEDISLELEKELIDRGYGCVLTDGMVVRDFSFRVKNPYEKILHNAEDLHCVSEHISRSQLQEVVASGNYKKYTESGIPDEWHDPHLDTLMTTSIARQAWQNDRENIKHLPPDYRRVSWFVEALQTNPKWIKYATYEQRKAEGCRLISAAFNGATTDEQDYRVNQYKPNACKGCALKGFAE